MSSSIAINGGVTVSGSPISGADLMTTGIPASTADGRANSNSSLGAPLMMIPSGFSATACSKLRRMSSGFGAKVMGIISQSSGAAAAS